MGEDRRRKLGGEARDVKCETRRGRNGEFAVAYRGTEKLFATTCGLEEAAT